jgi:membrane protease YdiL (CAAX protease family)
MLVSFLSKLRYPASGTATSYKWWMVVVLVAWVFVGFLLAQLIVMLVVEGLKTLGVPLEVLDSTVLNAIFAAFIYAVSLAIVIGVPWLVRRVRTNRVDLGLSRLPEWFDLLLAPAGFIIYIFGSGLIMYALTQWVPGFDAAQQQNIGFHNLVKNYELVLAFVTLVLIAPLAEETLFRGYLYGKLRKSVPIWAAMLATSALFGFLHGQWNVGIDVFILSLVMCTLREITGSIWAGVMVHMIKNGVAFFILFIYPILSHTIGG